MNWVMNLIACLVYGKVNAYLPFCFLCIFLGLLFVLVVMKSNYAIRLSCCSLWFVKGTFFVMVLVAAHAAVEAISGSRYQLSFNSRFGGLQEAPGFFELNWVFSSQLFALTTSRASHLHFRDSCYLFLVASKFASASLIWCLSWVFHFAALMFWINCRFQKVVLWNF